MVNVVSQLLNKKHFTFFKLLTAEWMGGAYI